MNTILTDIISRTFDQLKDKCCFCDRELEDEMTHDFDNGDKSCLNCFDNESCE